MSTKKWGGEGQNPCLLRKCIITNNKGWNVLKCKNMQSSDIIVRVSVKTLKFLFFHNIKISFQNHLFQAFLILKYMYMQMCKVMSFKAAVKKKWYFQRSAPLRPDPPPPGLNGAFSKKYPFFKSGIKLKIIKIDIFDLKKKW